MVQVPAGLQAGHTFAVQPPQIVTTPGTVGAPVMVQPQPQYNQQQMQPQQPAQQAPGYQGFTPYQPQPAMQQQPNYEQANKPNYELSECSSPLQSGRKRCRRKRRRT